MKSNNKIKRYFYNTLGNKVFQIGAMGSLQTLYNLPVVAGDSLKLNFDSVFRLSPLRRTLPADAVIDLFLFFVPHRHIYGSDWTTFMKEGMDTTTTIPTYEFDGTGCNCVGEVCVDGSVVPRHILAAYSRVWNFYFRNPTSPADIIDDDHLLDAGSEARTYGVQCCHLPAIWNKGVDDTIATGDRDYTVVGDLVDLPDFSAQVARLRTEIDRDYKGQRYFDLMYSIFGGHVNTDADQRPELLGHTRQYLSGFDVDGTDSASLGIQSGKAVSRGGISMPYKFFPEHGSLLVMSTVRFMPLASTERHYLSFGSPTYAEISGDPDIISRTEPINATTDMFFHDGDTTALNKIPFGQWYREGKPNIHTAFKDIAGHVFINAAPSTTAKAYYTTHDLYDSVFQSLQLKHWQSYANIDIEGYRVVPPPMKSIYAGTNL